MLKSYLSKIQNFRNLHIGTYLFRELKNNLSIYINIAATKYHKYEKNGRNRKPCVKVEELWNGVEQAPASSSPLYSVSGTEFRVAIKLES